MPALHRDIQIDASFRDNVLVAGLKIPCDPTEFLVLGRRKGEGDVHEGIVSRKGVDACLHVA